MCNDAGNEHVMIVSKKAADGEKLKPDEVSSLEIVLSSNGWFRSRIGGEQWVFWSQLNKSHQEIADSAAFKLIRETPKGLCKNVLPGSVFGDSNTFACTVSVTKGELLCRFHRAVIETADRVTMPRDNISNVKFVDLRLADIPTTPD